jgi:hypothetical protein
MIEPNGEDPPTDTQQQIDDRHRERVRRAIMRVPDPQKQVMAMAVGVETIVKLLIDKGICTVSDYHAMNAKVADEMIPHQSLIIPRGR